MTATPPAEAPGPAPRIVSGPSTPPPGADPVWHPLRPLSPADPASGQTALLLLPADSPGLPDTTSWRELFVLDGRLRLGDALLDADDYAWRPDASSGPPVATPADRSAVVFAVLGPADIRPDGARPTAIRRATRRSSWGYLDLRDGTDRLALRLDRQRGEASWLERWPPGYEGGPPTRAEGVALEVLVLSGELQVLGLAQVLGPRDYALFEPATLAASWRSDAGCEALCRTIAGDA